MEKTKDQILLEKLRKAGRLTRMRPGMPFPPMGGRPMMPPMPGRGPMMPPTPGCGPMGGPDAQMCGPRGPMHGPHGPKGVRMAREILLLTVLESGENGIRQKDIAEAIGINASSLSEQIDALEAARYLERKANPEDKRSTLITLTEKGRARAYEIQDERQKVAAAFFSRLTEEEKDALIALLDKLLDAPAAP